MLLSNVIAQVVQANLSIVLKQHQLEVPLPDGRMGALQSNPVPIGDVEEQPVHRAIHLVGFLLQNGSE